MLESIANIFSNASGFQIAFYIISPIATFLAVGTAYLAIYKQSKPLVLAYYRASTEIGSIIELVICNHGNGTARNVKFSEPIPIRCWGIDAPQNIDESLFFNYEIPILAPGMELRYDGGQYGGLYSIIGKGKVVTANYTYKTPLRSKKTGSDTSILDVQYMQYMTARNSAAHNLSDAMKGNNQTVFAAMNKILTSIDASLSKIASAKVNEIEDENNKKQEA